jgi:hypothetical protein
MLLFRIIGGAIMFTVFWIVVITLMFLMEPVEAQESQCRSHGLMIAELLAQFGEEPANQGVAGTNGDFLMETFANPSTGTWTIVMVNSAGIACMIASGTGFSGVPNA